MSEECPKIARIMIPATRVIFEKQRAFRAADGSNWKHFDASAVIFAKRSKLKSCPGNHLRIRSGARQNQNPKIRERHAHFDTHSSKLQYQNSPRLPAPCSLPKYLSPSRKPRGFAKATNRICRLRVAFGRVSRLARVSYLSVLLRTCPWISVTTQAAHFLGRMV